MSTGGSTKVVMMALMANLGIALAKGIGAAISGSASLLAEAVHSLVDCTNQLMLLFGGRAAAKKPTETHPLGYGREAFFWSFLVTLLLFSLGGVFAIWEGFHHLSHSESLSSPLLAVGILGISFFLELASFITCLKEIRKQNEFGGIWTWFRKTTSSELLVVFTEDLAAILGLGIATVCLLISWLTGDVQWDAYGSILIGILLVVLALLLAVEIKSLIIGEAPSINFRTEVARIVAKTIPGGELLHLIAVQTGGSEVMLSYKISPGSVKDVKVLIDSINDVERQVRSLFPEVRWQFVEPDHVV